MATLERRPAATQSADGKMEETVTGGSLKQMFGDSFDGVCDACESSLAMLCLNCSACHALHVPSGTEGKDMKERPKALPETLEALAPWERLYQTKARARSL